MTSGDYYSSSFSQRAYIRDTCIQGS
jgi:CubicO group peptidase (beta-lactamase class C family)